MYDNAPEWDYVQYRKKKKSSIIYTVPKTFERLPLYVADLDQSQSWL